MILVQLTGALGNQMFQYAAGRRLASKRQTELVLDITQFGRQVEGETSRDYMLDCFKLSARMATVEELARVIPDEIGPRWKLAYRLLKQRKILTLREHNHKFDPRILSAPDNTYLVGNVQSHAYFDDVEGIIRNDVSFIRPLSGGNEATAGMITQTESVSLHVRRGDFVTNAVASKFHGVLPVDYYQAAVEYLTKTLGNPHFYVFSDDPEWCKANLTFETQTSYIDHNPPSKGFEDMRLMSLCQHHIIANSSFSWWGAWLGANPTKQVIAPKAWFKDSSYSADTLIPSSWITL